MSFVTKSFINTLGAALFGAVNLLIGILLARWLLPAGEGQYRLVASAVLLIGEAATLGVGQAAIYHINRKKIDPSIVATVAFKFSLVMGFATLLILLAILHYRPYFGEIPFWVILICSIQGAAVTLIAGLYPILIAFLQVKKYNLVRLAPRVIALLLIIAGILLGVMNINYAWVVVSIGQICGILTLLYLLRRWISFGIPFEWPLFKSLVIYGAKLILSYIVYMLNGAIGLLLLRYFLPHDFSEVGYYSRAIRLSGVLLLLSGALAPLLYSKWSSVDSIERQHQAERVSRVFWALLISVIAILEILAGYLVPFLYGIEFLPAVPIMRILLIGIGVRFLLAPLFQVFFGGGKPLLTSFILIVNLAIMAILMALLVPRYAGIGAAVAFSASNCVALCLGYAVSYKKFGVRPHRSLVLTGEDIRYFIRALRL